MENQKGRNNYHIQTLTYKIYKMKFDNRSVYIPPQNWSAAFVFKDENLRRKLKDEVLEEECAFYFSVLGTSFTFQQLLTMVMSGLRPDGAWTSGAVE